MEQLGNSFYKELLRATGANVEELGNLLKSKKEFTDEELHDIQFALRRAADTIETIRDRPSTTKVQD